MLALGISGAAATGATAHLPAARENVELVSKLELKGKFGNVLPEQIADVAVHENHAYLNSWSGSTNAVVAGNCERGGTFIVDITDPAKPVETGFVAARTGSYHGDGAHVITLESGPLKGRDILGVNNMPCKSGPGGFDLIDVTDPRNPVVLTAAFGDTGGENSATGVDSLTGAGPPHSNLDIFLWNFAGKAYAVTADAFEANDVNIFDITDPAAPQPVIGFGLHDANDVDPAFALIPEPTLDKRSKHHGSTVKIIDGKPILLTSYGDSGYQTFDISDPAKPVHIGDTSFAGPDPLLGIAPQEGNAHYAEFSHDNRYVLTADEDSRPYRAGKFEIATGQNAGEHPVSPPPGSTGVEVLPDRRLNGPVVYGGFGCPAGGGGKPGSPQIPVPPRSQYSNAQLGLDPGEEAILVLSRGPSNHPDYPEADDNPPGPYAPGGCYAGEKVGMAQQAGWDAVVLVNRHFGSAAADSANCGSGGYSPTIVIPSLCTTHTAFHLMFNDEPNYDADYTPNSEPELGDIGEHVNSAAVFDGWGSTRLFENEPGTMTQVGAYAIEEALDSRFAFGFGNLSVHEWATDPTEHLAYGANYSGGVRVVSFGPNGIEEQGRFIDEGGSNVWGVEQFTTPGGERLIAASDRDRGLYILRYTGAQAARPPACQDVAAVTEVDKAVSIPLTCTDPNGNPLALTISTPPASGTLSAIDKGAVVYTPNAGFTGDDSFTYRASDGAASSAPATVRIRVVPKPPIGPCGPVVLGTIAGEILNGTASRDTILAGAGNDTVGGLQGDDCLFGEAGDDRIVAGAGNDKVDGGTGKDRLFGDSGADEIRGRAGNDHVRGSSGNDRLLGDAGNDHVSGGSNNDTISGGAGRDSLQGDAGDDVIEGGAGNDSINTGKGRNRVDAGAGADRVVAVNGSRDKIKCGKGRDVVRADRADRVSRSCERVLRTRTTRRPRR